MGIQLVYHMLVASRSSDDSVDVPLLGDGLAYYGASDLEAPSPLEVRFGVSGMTCASCVKTVETAVGRVPSVVDVAVNLLAGEAAVTLSSQSADPMDVVDAIERLGYEAVLKGLPSQVGSTTLLVEGMTCSSCVGSVETALMGVAGVSDALVNLLSGHVKVFFDERVVGVRTLIKRVKDLGYEASVLRTDEGGRSMAGRTTRSATSLPTWMSSWPWGRRPRTFTLFSWSSSRGLSGPSPEGCSTRQPLSSSRLLSVASTSKRRPRDGRRRQSSRFSLFNLRPRFSSLVTVRKRRLMLSL